jgi:EAL domain-containing protein (putative c-di-GMP-specific phosphodiesterase class I)
LPLLPLSHPLEHYTAFIRQLIDSYSDRQPNGQSPSQELILQTLQQATAATKVMLWRENQPIPLTHEPALDTLLLQLLTEVRDRHWSQLSTGFCHRYEAHNTAFAALLLPVYDQAHCSWLVLEMPEPTELTDEIYGKILVAFYTAVQTLSWPQAALIEAQILDDLKQGYGELAICLADRRFQLFCDRLSQMIVYFEPVLCLDPDYLYIDSWEALARNPDQATAPCDLFRAAELWGDRFMVELDAYFLRQAIRQYHQADHTASGRRKQDIRELSVNVYPPSLVQQSYFETLQQVMQDKLIQPEKLILEISEKLPLPVPQLPTESAMESFRRRLGRYVREFKIGFAIDDFGVGHASVSRLTGLNPAHVKIDRDLLHQDQECSAITLRFVLDLASSRLLRAPKVVVEGFDDESPVTLRQLHQSGIRYVQGHLIGKATPQLYRLDKDQYDYLKRLIQGGR